MTKTLAVIYCCKVILRICLLFRALETSRPFLLTFHLQFFRQVKNGVTHTYGGGLSHTYDGGVSHTVF